MRFEIVTSLILFWSSDQNAGTYSQVNKTNLFGGIALICTVYGSIRLAGLS